VPKPTERRASRVGRTPPPRAKEAKLLTPEALEKMGWNSLGPRLKGVNDEPPLGVVKRPFTCHDCGSRKWAWHSPAEEGIFFGIPRNKIEIGGAKGTVSLGRVKQSFLDAIRYHISKMSYLVIGVTKAAHKGDWAKVKDQIRRVEVAEDSIELFIESVETIWPPSDNCLRNYTRPRDGAEGKGMMTTELEGNIEWARRKVDSTFDKIDHVVKKCRLLNHEEYLKELIHNSNSPEGDTE